MVISSAIKRVGVLTNPTKANAQQVYHELREWIAKRNIDVLDSAEIPLEKMLPEVDLFICLGGDGTMLHLAGKMIDRSVPVLGVNIGSLGFLTEVRVEELYDELKLVFSGQFEVEERMLLTATVKWEGVDPLHGRSNRCRRGTCDTLFWRWRYCCDTDRFYRLFFVSRRPDCASFLERPHRYPYLPACFCVEVVSSFRRPIDTDSNYV